MKILTHPDERLSQKCEPVGRIDVDVLATLFAMAHELRRPRDVLGVGLAAPQVGWLSRAFVLNLGDGLDTTLAFIDPVVIVASRETAEELEECLSVPGVEVAIRRPVRVLVEATVLAWSHLDGYSEVMAAHARVLGRMRYQAKRGLESRVILHELDHCDGKSILDHKKEPATCSPAIKKPG